MITSRGRHTRAAPPYPTRLAILTHVLCPSVSMLVTLRAPVGYGGGVEVPKAIHVLTGLL